MASSHDKSDNKLSRIPPENNDNRKNKTKWYKIYQERFDFQRNFPSLCGIMKKFNEPLVHLFSIGVEKGAASSNNFLVFVQWEPRIFFFALKNFPPKFSITFGAD